jgi:uncharacterized protein
VTSAVATAATTVEIATPSGPARAHLHPAERRATASLVLGHGAGGGVGAADLQALARALPPLGVTVVLVEQPWRVAGKRVAAAPPRLDEAWLAVLASLRAGGAGGPLPPRRRLVVGGRSAGARVACRTAAAAGAERVVCLAFPLHPPGRPERSRADELLAVQVPALVVQGARDPFGGPADLPAGPTVVEVPYADHSFAVPGSAPVTRREALDVVVDAVARFLVPR